MKLNFIIIAFNLLLFSCATTLPEGEAYKYIIDLNKNDKYSSAAFEIFKFEAAYPESMHICQLWEIHYQYYTQRDINKGYVEKLKEKYKSRCKKSLQ